MADNSDVLYQISKALYSKFTALDGSGEPNAFYSAVNGALFEDRAPQGSNYPYVVWHIIDSPKERTFSEEMRDTLIQFDIFSSDSSSVEIKNIYFHLSDLYDEKALSITGSTLICMREETMHVLPPEDETTPEGTRTIKHYIVDFSIYTVLT